MTLRPARTVAILLIVAVLVLVGVINRRRSADAGRTAPSVTPVPSVTPRPRATDALHGPVIGDVRLPGPVIDVAARSPLIYALTARPSTLVRLGPEQPVTVTGTTDTASTSYGLALDDQASRVWVLSRTGPHSTELREYDPLSLSPMSTVTISSLVTAALGFDQRLWLGTPDGLYVVDDGSVQPRLVAGTQGTITALGEDVAGDRILLTRAARDGVDVLAVGYDKKVEARRAWLPVRADSLAVVQSDLWIGGTGSDQRGVLLHLDVASLRLLGSEARAQDAEHTAVWAGDTVLWASVGARLFCLDPQSGSTLTSTVGMTGPVVPNLGQAYAIGHGTLHVLSLERTGCYQG